MFSRAISYMILGAMWLLVSGSPVVAQDSQPTERQIQAAFLFNFAKFVRWPDSAFPAGTSPLVIGVLGDNPFHDDLPRIVKNKTVDDHPILVKEFKTVAEATNCQVLFVSSSEKKRFQAILEGLKNSNVLTVGDSENFTEVGGMINFVAQGTKVRFKINTAAATRAGLKISSKLISLAINTDG